jgi:hypothetical protein
MFLRVKNAIIGLIFKNSVLKCLTRFQSGHKLNFVRESEKSNKEENIKVM